MVSELEFQKDNHYVPRLYLKRWADANQKVNTYRLLISHQNLPLWKRQSTKGLAYHDHLYTRVMAKGRTDEIERWLAREFENPADGVIKQVISGGRLSKDDWECLIRFAAAQDVRTPARLIETMRRGNDGSLQQLIEHVLATSVAELTEAKREGRSVRHIPTPDAEYLPTRVTTKIDPGAKQGILGLELTVGRAYWLFHIRHLLNNTAKVLLRHHWTIVRPPRGMLWLTSDDPFIKLNYYSPGHYDFKGGWGREGTDLVLPLSPEHMLFTTIGRRPAWTRDHRIPEAAALQLQRFTVEHAHRMIFATYDDPLVQKIRARIVDAAAYEHEKKQWLTWNDEQSAAEEALLGRG